ncbi:unnamed protein product [Paramecium pentaurelia]|uniref:Uncharacterized protein n=1 Tax=Paramecium pentaurelia TaxID=43138 RepID=A0A8S1UIF2_9CILI|nr:unnamed protein product [Paramecium pentaurelia]
MFKYWKIYSPVFIMTKEEDKNFASNTSLLFNNGNTYIGKGLVKNKNLMYLLKEINLTYKMYVLKGSFDCNADFHIEKFGLKYKLESKYKLGQGFPVSLKLHFQEYSFECNINYFLYKIKGNLETDFFLDITGLIKINKCGFEFGFNPILGFNLNLIFSLNFLTTKRNIVTLKLIGIVNSILKILFVIKWGLEFLGVKRYLGVTIKSDNYQIKQSICNIKTQLQDLLKSSFDADISDELNKMQEEVDYFKQQKEKEKKKNVKKQNKKITKKISKIIIMNIKIKITNKKIIKKVQPILKAIASRPKR